MFYCVDYQSIFISLLFCFRQIKIVDLECYCWMVLYISHSRSTPIEEIIMDGSSDTPMTSVANNWYNSLFGKNSSVIHHSHQRQYNPTQHITTQQHKTTQHNNATQDNITQHTNTVCTPNGPPGGGIWQSGKGLASDGTYIYLSTGNGQFAPSSMFSLLNPGLFFPLQCLVLLSPPLLNLFSLQVEDMECVCSD